MNLLTFDIEEWYLEKILRGGSEVKYKLFDKTLGKLLDNLDNHGVKATFFCVGQLAKDFPDVIKTINEYGHEIGCHSNVHTWLNKMDEPTLRQDTQDAISILQDVSGQKVTAYRAPSFSITPKNKWAVGVLVDCGIESDSSIFPSDRDYGGYRGFSQDAHCIVNYKGASLKEYPINLTSVLGKSIAYSGGGYFRVLPYWFVRKSMNQRNYNISYFHLADLISDKIPFKTRKEYEDYFKEPGTLKNRIIRYIKTNICKGQAAYKLERLLDDYKFVCIQEADRLIDWKKANRVEL